RAPEPAGGCPDPRLRPSHRVAGPTRLRRYAPGTRVAEEEATLIKAYQHGVFPRSEDVVAATRGLERGRTSPDEVEVQFKRDREDLIQAQQEAGLDYFSDGLLRWQDIFRPLAETVEGMEARTLGRWLDRERG